jgi:SAM-dependent methyltransferase
MNLTANAIRVEKPGLIRSALRTPAFRALKYRILGSGFFRRLLTSNYSSGLVALGERNSYAFPMRWITVDWSQADFSFWFSHDSRLPFTDNSQRIVYSSHMMEHVKDDALAQLFQEIHRVLAPGGAVRIEVPDADKLVAAYRANDRIMLNYFREGRLDLVSRFPALGDRYLEDHLTVLGEIANYIDYTDGAVHIPVYASRETFERELEKGLTSFNAWAQSLKTPDQRETGGHANALTASKMETMLHVAGFAQVKLATYGQTAIPALRLGRGWRRVFDSVPETVSRAFYSLYIEAFK